MLVVCKLQVILDSGVSHTSIGAIADVPRRVVQIFPNRGVRNIPLLEPYSVNNFTGLRLQLASESAIMRARARPHTLAPPCLLPLTESGGEETRGALVLCG